MADSVNTGWDELPAAVREAIERHTGPVAEASPGGAGMSTVVRLILDTPGGSVFIKGISPDVSDVARERLELGAGLAPFVTALSPPLLFRAQVDGWDITGWPALPGRPTADFTPGSADIPKITALLARLGRIRAPDDVPSMPSPASPHGPRHPPERSPHTPSTVPGAGRGPAGGSRTTKASGPGSTSPASGPTTAPDSPEPEFPVPLD